MRSASLISLLALACAAPPPAPPTTPAPLANQGATQPGCSEEPRALAHIQHGELDEISGLVESRATRDVFFVHNDSGDSARFFAIDRAGRLLAELLLEDVPLLIDAEDIAIGPAPGGRHFLYLGDTGNNFASLGRGIPRRKAVLYRVPEPVIAPGARSVRLQLRDVHSIVFTFPDGARDVEAFFIDPRDGELFLVTKQTDGHSQILAADAATLAAGGGELRLLGEVVFGRGGPLGSRLPTAASITRDGSGILIRTLTTVLLFRRGPGESVMSALGRPPQALNAPSETQGEAIGFADGDTAFLTISEGFHPAIHCVKLPPW